jgi:hypothetical protein
MRSCSPPLFLVSLSGPRLRVAIAPAISHVDPITMGNRRPQRSACKISQFRRSAVPARIGRGAEMGQGAISSAFPSDCGQEILLSSGQPLALWPKRRGWTVLPPAPDTTPSPGWARSSPASNPSGVSEMASALPRGWPDRVLGAERGVMHPIFLVAYTSQPSQGKFSPRSSRMPCQRSSHAFLAFRLTSRDDDHQASPRLPRRAELPSQLSLCQAIRDQINSGTLLCSCCIRFTDSFHSSPNMQLHGRRTSGR